MGGWLSACSGIGAASHSGVEVYQWRRTQCSQWIECESDLQLIFDCVTGGDFGVSIFFDCVTGEACGASSIFDCVAGEVACRIFDCVTRGGGLPEFDCSHCLASGIVALGTMGDFVLFFTAFESFRLPFFSLQAQQSPKPRGLQHNKPLEPARAGGAGSRTSSG